VASKGQIELILNTLDAAIKKPLIEAFRYTFSWFSLGGNVKAENFAWYQATGTTASVANTEFSIVHGMDHVPRWVIPVVDLNSVGSQLVPLTVSRAPDAMRVYLKSSSTSAAFTCYLE